MDEGMNINYMLYHRFPFCGCFPHAHLGPIYPESQLLVKKPGYTAPTPLFTVCTMCVLMLYANRIRVSSLNPIHILLAEHKSQTMQLDV